VFLSKMANPQNDPPSPLDTEADRALIAPESILPIFTNNEYVDLANIRIQHMVVREILRAHPIAYAMTARADVPETYLQQFWATATLDSRFGMFSIVARVDESEVIINLEDVRRSLHLPAATDDGHVEFDPLVVGPALLNEIRALGVTRLVNGVSQVTTSMLPPIWAQMYNLMNRSLSSKVKGTDKATTPFWQIFHSVAYGRRIDVASQLWLDITKDLTARERSRHTSVPWMRFIALFIRDHLDRNPEIRRRSSHPVFSPKPITWVAKREYVPNQQEMQIPLHVLNTADQNAPSIIAYRAAHGLDAAPGDAPVDPPVIPTIVPEVVPPPARK